MAEDRFANVYTSDLTMSGVDELTFLQLNFGLNLRDKIAIVIDQCYFYISGVNLAEFLTNNDSLAIAITMWDQVTNVFQSGLGDRRVIFTTEFRRTDFGAAASGQFYTMPITVEFSPPILVLPTRLFFAVDSSGLVTPAQCILRMHYRTVNITQQDQLIEVLETFQLSN